MQRVALKYFVAMADDGSTFSRSAAHGRLGRGVSGNQRNAVLARVGMALLSAVAPPELRTTTLVPTLARP
jgi:hypothetical protein